MGTKTWHWAELRAAPESRRSQPQKQGYQTHCEEESSSRGVSWCLLDGLAGHPLKPSQLSVTFRAPARLGNNSSWKRPASLRVQGQREGPQVPGQRNALEVSDGLSASNRKKWNSYDRTGPYPASHRTLKSKEMATQKNSNKSEENGDVNIFGKKITVTAIIIAAIYWALPLPHILF